MAVGRQLACNPCEPKRGGGVVPTSPRQKSSPTAPKLQERIVMTVGRRPSLWLRGNPCEPCSESENLPRQVEHLGACLGGPRRIKRVQSSQKKKTNGEGKVLVYLCLFLLLHTTSVYKFIKIIELLWLLAFDSFGDPYIHIWESIIEFFGCFCVFVYTMVSRYVIYKI